MTGLTDSPVSRRNVLKGMGGVALTASFGGLLAACGGSSSSSSGAAQVNAWNYRPEWKKILDGMIGDFEKSHEGIDVEMTYKATTQFETALKTALVGGAGPDTWSTSGASGIYGDLGAGGGYLRPLEGLIDAATLQPAVAKVINYEGKVYGAPVLTFKIGIYYQKAIFEKHGLSAPRTWDDLLELGQTLKSNGETAWAMPAQDMTLPYFFYHLAVNSILGDESVSALASGERELTEPDLVKAVELMVEASDTFNAGFEAVAFAEGKALFAQEQAAMTIGGSSDYAVYAEINPDLDVGFVGFPSPSGATPPTALNGLSMAYVVNKQAGDSDASAAFAAWLTTEPAQKVVLAELGLPSIRGLKPAGSSKRDELLGAALEVSSSPSWLDYPATGGTITAVQTTGGGIFTGDVSPEQFAAAVQKSIVVS